MKQVLPYGSVSMVGFALLSNKMQVEMQGHAGMLPCLNSMIILRRRLVNDAGKKVYFRYKSRNQFSASQALSQLAEAASAGICQSPRGLRPTEPTFTPSGEQLRLNCWVKKRR